MTDDIFKAAKLVRETSALRAAIEAANSREAKLAAELVRSPAVQVARDLQRSGALAAAAELAKSPVIEAAKELQSSGVLAVAAELARANDWQKTLAPVSIATQALAEQLAVSGRFRDLYQPPSWLIEMTSMIERIRLHIPTILETVQRVTEPFKDFFAEIARQEAQRRRMEEAGWLAHYTTPIGAVMAAKDDEIDALLETHYTDNWAEVEAAFIERLQGYNVDEEAKATFNEALTSHRHGLYRTVPRTLFPEIERVARLELHTPTDNRITNQKKLIEIAGDLLPGETEHYGHYGLALYVTLSEHVYAHCDLTELTEISENAVPNRHAVVHGFVSYSKRKNSINALIMTDFIFQIINAAKSVAVEEVVEPEPDAA